MKRGGGYHKHQCNTFKVVLFQLGKKIHTMNILPYQYFAGEVYQLIGFTPLLITS